MSAKERIGRLQELLERVQARAAAPRVNGAAHVDGAGPATPAMHAQPEERAVAYESEAPPTDNYDYDGDVEVSSEVVEVDIDIDEPIHAESGAQPVAHATMPPEDLVEELEEPASATQSSHHPAAHGAEAEDRTQASMSAPPANGIEEPAPSSSRRPIAGEAPVAEAYEAESSPRHTPPPESGKQVAAPSVQPPSRKPTSMPPPTSAPPPSLEGHTLIGGWREPGLGTPQISPAAGMTTGVRVPPPPGAFAREGVPAPAGGRPTEPPLTVSQAQAAQGSGTRLTADVTKPELAASATVASFEGAAPVARPTTLGELLDLTLGL